MRPFLALVLLLGFVPASSEARCVSQDCLCQGAQGLAEVEIVAAATETKPPEGRVVSLFGQTGSVAVGDVVPFDQFLGRAPASGRFLIAISSPHFGLGPIDAAGNVLCTGSVKEFKVPLAEAMNIALADDCSQQTAARGFEQPPCNDTGPVFPPGCTSAGVAGAALGLLALARRRRR